MKLGEVIFHTFGTSDYQVAHNLTLLSWRHDWNITRIKRFVLLKGWFTWLCVIRNFNQYVSNLGLKKHGQLIYNTEILTFSLVMPWTLPIYIWCLSSVLKLFVATKWHSGTTFMLCVFRLNSHFLYLYSMFVANSSTIRDINGIVTCYQFIAIEGLGCSKLVFSHTLYPFKLI